MTSGRKLAVGAAVIGGVTAYMAYVGAASSWQYYVTADECAADARSLIGERIRVSGQVAPESLQIAADRTHAAFLLAGTKGKLQVSYSGPLPDNLAEGVEVVAEGRLERADQFKADKVLTRCASKYQSEGSPVSTRSAARTKQDAVR